MHTKKGFFPLSCLFLFFLLFIYYYYLYFIFLQEVVGCLGK